jgi:SAM-dependent methyltransferase
MIDEKVQKEKEFLSPWVRRDAMSASSSSLALDLGSGPSPRNPFEAAKVFGADIRGGQDIFKVDIVASQSLPFPDALFGYITAHDFIEHVPRVLVVDGKTIHPFIDLMNEIYRLLAVGGLFYSKTPAWPHPEVFVDPTHVNVITEHTFPAYFSGSAPWAANYGFYGCFELLSQDWAGCHLLTLLKKIQ